MDRNQDQDIDTENKKQMFQIENICCGSVNEGTLFVECVYYVMFKHSLILKKKKVL